MAASTAFEIFLSGAETLLISLSHLKPETPPPPTTLETAVACAKVGGMIFRKFWCPSALEIGLAVVAELRRGYVEKEAKGSKKIAGRKKSPVGKKGGEVKKGVVKEKVGVGEKRGGVKKTSAKKSKGVQKRTSARKTRATRKPAMMPGAFDNELDE